MEYTKVLNGERGFGATGFAISALLSQTGFDLKRAVFQGQKKDKAAIHDARYDEAMGENAVPAEKKLDIDDLIKGMASGFVLLSRFIQKPNPEDGKKPVHLKRWLKGPAEVIEEQIEWQLANDKQSTAADAAALGVDLSKRQAALAAAIRANAEKQIEPHVTAFCKLLKEYRAIDDSVLVDQLVTTVTNAGRDPAKDIKRAADFYVEQQKKRAESGLFFRLDMSIVALTKM